MKISKGAENAVATTREERQTAKEKIASPLQPDITICGIYAGMRFVVFEAHRHDLHIELYGNQNETK